jgi:isoquinoline 1-oxidoreductase beta subunit
MNVHIKKPSRRAVLQGIGGLVIAFHLPRGARAQSLASGKNIVFAPNAFIRIGADDLVTVLSKHGSAVGGCGLCQ